MRIQHNITAMNAYRNYNNNTSAIGKNLEKLSSGYKINRAGDDAAGLAVSQKMRLQIAGLAQAQKNAKSGISYIQTAEGALQEVHEMLERMYTLAEQSANGAFDDSTDRTQLQKEVNNLMEEIDRIGKTANFNGMGIFAEYAGGGGGGGSDEITFYEAEAKIAGAAVTGADQAEATTAAKEAVYEINVTSMTTGDALTIDGKTYTYNTDLTTTFTSCTASAEDTTGGKYTIQYNDTDKKLTITAKNTGPDSLALTDNDKVGGTKATLTEKTKGADETTVPAHKTYDLSGVLAAGDEITVNDKKYTFDGSAGTGDKTKFKDLSDLKTKLEADGVTMDDTDPSKVTFQEKAGGGNGNGGGGGKGIKFWVGAEWSTDNILELKAMNLSSDNMQIGESDVTAKAGKKPKKVQQGNLKQVDIRDADKAMKSLTTIRDASNAVSNMRGTLGAMQNRLDHTLKNLSVMQENMQDAESVIRDTDVAEEMMAYTKNNILVQSAQAMLAQANQIPQGVLQLLQ